MIKIVSPSVLLKNSPSNVGEYNDEGRRINRNDKSLDVTVSKVYHDSGKEMTDAEQIKLHFNMFPRDEEYRQPTGFHWRFKKCIRSIKNWYNYGTTN